MKEEEKKEKSKDRIKIIHEQTWRNNYDGKD